MLGFLLSVWHSVSRSLAAMRYFLTYALPFRMIGSSYISFRTHNRYEHPSGAYKTMLTLYDHYVCKVYINRNI